MTPIFNRETIHVGWYGGDNVFDIDGLWLAFHVDGHLFSAATLEWLGPFVAGSFADRSGRVVGWLAGTAPGGVDRPHPPAQPARPMTPLRPVRPIAPRRPLFPRLPQFGWSDLSWAGWLGGTAAPSGQEAGADPTSR